MAAFQGKIIIDEIPGQYCRAQLFNPNGSGKTVLVDSILSIMGLFAADIIFYFTQTQQGTDGGQWRNVVADGTAGAAHVRSETSAGSLVSNPFGDVYLLKSIMLDKKLTNPIIIPAGWGLSGETPVIFNAIGLWFEGREY